MKSLEQIKEEYARNQKCKSWENFCFVANDSMFVRAIDEIATLYAESRASLVVSARLQSLHLVPEQLQERFG